MMRNLSHTSLVLATTLVSACIVSNAQSTELSAGFQDWQSFENQKMADEYNQSAYQQRKKLQSNLKSAVEHSIQSIGISETSVRYMGAAIGLATQDTVIHLNDNKTLALELMDVSQSDRGVFVGYSTSW